MLLNKSKQNSSGPFLSVEVVKLSGAFALWLINIIIIGRINESYNKRKKIHPIQHEFFNWIIDFIVYSFPYEFRNKINKLGLGISLSY